MIDEKMTLAEEQVYKKLYYRKGGELEREQEQKQSIMYRMFRPHKADYTSVGVKEANVPVEHQYDTRRNVYPSSIGLQDHLWK